jgi:hypothetical protein
VDFGDWPHVIGMLDMEYAAQGSSVVALARVFSEFGELRRDGAREGL